jgi:hypothetical protein
MAHSISFRRAVTRGLHLAASLPLGTLVYAPAEFADQIRPLVQIVLFPALGVSGIWMWQGSRLRRLLQPARPISPKA